MGDTDNPDHHNPPSLPPDYVSLADLQQRWHHQQQQQKIKHPTLGDPSNDGPHKLRINGQLPRRSPEFASPRSIGRSGDRKEFSVVKVVPQSSTLRDIGGGGGREKRVKDEKFIKERGGKKGMQSESLKGEYIVKGKVEIDGGDRNGNEKGKKDRQSEVLKVGLVVKGKVEINGGDRKGTEKMKNGVSGKKGMQSEPLKVEHVVKGKVGIDGEDRNGNEKMKNEVNGKKGMQSEPLKVEHVVKGKVEIDVRERNGKKGMQAEVLRVGHFVNRKVEFNDGNGAWIEKMMEESSEKRGMQSERSKVGGRDGGDPTEGKNKKKKKKKTKKKMGKRMGRNLRGNGGNGDEKEVDEKQEAYDDRTLQTRGMVAKEDGDYSTLEKEDSGHRMAEVWRRVGRKAGGNGMAEIGWKVEKEDGGDQTVEIGPRFEKLNVNRRGWGRGVWGGNRRQTDGIEERRQVYRSYGRVEHRGMERENGMVWVKKGEVSEQSEVKVAGVTNCVNGLAFS